MNNDEPQRRVLGTWIQKRRAYLRWTQATLAEKLGCTADLIGKIERGKRNVSARMAPKIVEAFGLADEEKANFLRLVRSIGTPKTPSYALALPQSLKASINLPEPIPLLIGRETDVATSTSLLNTPVVRLLTLTGPPGIGKTRLSIEIAHHLRGMYQDGICFVPLAPLPPGSDILPTLFENFSVTMQIATPNAMPVAMPISQPKPEDALMTLARVLTHRHLLMVLDNFEHVLTEANLHTLSTLLSTCPKLKIIITSRSALNIHAEHLVAVKPLTLPDEHQIQNLTLLAQQPAVALFLGRAQSVDSAFRLTPANAQSVCKLCAFSEGMPLVLELLAARVRLLSPESLFSKIKASEAPADFLLTLTGPRDSPEHQRTLAQAIGWSYNLLQPEEQEMLMKLSVFAGGFTLEAAIAVCDATLPMLESLISHSLVQTQMWATHDYGNALNNLEDWNDEASDNFLSALPDDLLIEPSTQTPVEARYGLLESIRIFALQHLRASAHYTLACRRHAAHILQEVTEANGGGANIRIADRRLRHDLDNVRAALRWSHSPAGDVDLALQLTLRLTPWWWQHGYMNERMYWLQSALNRVAPHTLSRLQHSPLADAPADDVNQPEPIRRAVLHLLAGLLLDRANIGLADIKALLTQQLTLAREMNDQRIQIVHFRNLLFHISNLAPDDPDVLDIEQQALALSGELNEPVLLAQLWVAIGMPARIRGDLQKTITYLSRSRDLFRQLGDQQNEATQILALAVVELTLGDTQPINTAAVLADLLIAFRTFLDYRNMNGLTWTCLTLCMHAARESQWERCVTLFYAAEQLRAQHDIILARYDATLVARSLSKAQAALPSAVFDAARHVGKTLPLKEIVRMVLAKTPEAAT